MPAASRVEIKRSEFDAYIQSIHEVLVQNVKTISDLHLVQKNLETLIQKITRSNIHILIGKIMQQLNLILDAAFSGFLVCNPEFTQEQVAVFLQRCIDRALDVDENPNALLTNYILIVPDPAPAPEAVPEPALEPEAVPEPTPKPEAAPEPAPASVLVSEPPQTKKLVLKF